MSSRKQVFVVHTRGKFDQKMFAVRIEMVATSYSKGDITNDILCNGFLTTVSKVPYRI